MRIIGISCVRDEEDIIESFVRHNLVYLDKLYIVDNLSKDKTVDILNSLAKEGLEIELWESSSCSNQQDRAITAALKKAARQDTGADFAFLLDADEFLGASDRQTLIEDLGKIGTNGYGLMPWKTYIPVENDLENLNPSIPVTLRMTHRRSQEGYQMFKSVIPKALFGKVRILPGSHVVRRLDGGACPKFMLSSPLAHFPIRSAAQLIAKIILSNHSRMMKKDSLPNESFHWMEMSESIRERNFRVTTDQIRQYALTYSVRPADEKPAEFVFDPLPEHASVVVAYGGTESSSLLHRFDRYITRLHENNHIVPIAETEFEKREFHLIGEVRATFKQCKRWVKRHLGLSRKK
jgi:hypothetical protein